MLDNQGMARRLHVGPGVDLESVDTIGVWISSPEGVHFLQGAVYPAMLPLLNEGKATADELASEVGPQHGYAAAYHAVAQLERLGVFHGREVSGSMRHCGEGSPGPLAATANWVAAARARESGRPDRLFDDPLAGVLAGDVGFSWLAKHPQIVDGISVRTRFFDDFLLDATASGIRQVVILASGLDMRSWRIEWPEGVRIFELDGREVLARKCSIAESAGAVPRCHSTFIGADLTIDWKNQLLGAAVGFDPAKPAVWLVEGLLVYLGYSQVRSLFDEVAELSPPGSRIGIDLVSGLVLDPRRNFTWLKDLRERGCPWRFGTDDPARFLDDLGWDASVFSFEDVAKRYGRGRPVRDSVTTHEATDRSGSFLVTAVRRHGGE